MLDHIFDYIGYLKRHSMIGPMHPWNKNDQAAPIMGLLVPVQSALDEIIGWTGQDITRNEFLAHLKENNISVFNNIDEFVNLKSKPIDGQQQHREKRTTYPKYRQSPRLPELADRLEVSRTRIKYDDQRGWLIVGKSGDIYLDEENWYIYATAKSKRHFSSLKRQLAFMTLLSSFIEDGFVCGEFSLPIDRFPTSGEATIIRKFAGLKKSRPKIVSTSGFQPVKDRGSDHQQGVSV
jgi:hypothetical protein